MMNYGVLNLVRRLYRKHDPVLGEPEAGADEEDLDTC